MRWLTRVAAASLVSLAGCYSISPLAVKNDVLASVHAGDSASGAFQSLKTKGFSPKYAGAGQIIGHRTTGWLLFSEVDWVDARVDLNTLGTVESVEASMDQAYP